MTDVNEVFDKKFENVRHQIGLSLFNHFADYDQILAALPTSSFVHQLATIPFYTNVPKTLQKAASCFIQTEVQNTHGHDNSSISSSQIFKSVLKSKYLSLVLIGLKSLNIDLSKFRSTFSKIGTDNFDVSFLLELDNTWKSKVRSPEHEMLRLETPNLALLSTDFLTNCQKLRKRGFQPKDYISPKLLDKMFKTNSKSQGFSQGEGCEPNEMFISTISLAYSYFGCTKYSIQQITDLLCIETEDGEVESYNKLLKQKFQTIKSHKNVLEKLMKYCVECPENGSSTVRAFFESCLFPAPKSEIYLEQDHVEIDLKHPTGINLTNNSITLSCKIYSSKSGTKLPPTTAVKLFSITIGNDIFHLGIDKKSTKFVCNNRTICDVDLILAKGSWSEINWTITSEGNNVIFELNGRKIKLGPSPKKSGFLSNLNSIVGSYSVVVYDVPWKIGDLKLSVNSDESVSEILDAEQVILTKYKQDDSEELSVETSKIPDSINFRSTRLGAGYTALVKIGGINTILLLLARLVDHNEEPNSISNILKTFLKCSKMFNISLDKKLISSIFHVCDLQTDYVEILFDHVENPSVFEIMIDCSIWRRKDEVWRLVLVKLENLAQNCSKPPDFLRNFLLSLFGLPSVSVNFETTVLIIKLLQVLIGYPPELTSIKQVFSTVQALLPHGCHDLDKNSEYLNQSLAWLTMCTSKKTVAGAIKDRGIITRDSGFLVKTGPGTENSGYLNSTSNNSIPILTRRKRPNSISLTNAIEIATSVSNDAEQFSAERLDIVAEDVAIPDSDTPMTPGYPKYKVVLQKCHGNGREWLKKG